ncbi:extracellular calcium-sensing receptor-like [Gastrophryne carolinensis]
MRLVTLLYKTLWHLILHHFVPASCSSHQCMLDTSDLTGMFVSGDIVFGALLPLHVGKVYPKLYYKERPQQAICQKLSLDTYLQIQVLKFATMEINSRSEILRNITLGFQAYDTCSVVQRELEGTLWMVTGLSRAVPNFHCRRKEKLAAIIGHSTSTYSILMAHILGLSRYPQISHFSTSSLLGDRTQFLSFFRTVPSDAFQSKGLAQLVLHFGWTWVGLVAQSNDYGQHGIQVIKQEILKSGACVEFTEYIQLSQPNRNIPHIVKVIKDSTAQAIVVFSTDVNFLPLLDELIRENLTEKTWVASEAWSTSLLFTSEKYFGVLAGTIGFAFYSESIPGFQQYLDNVNPEELPERPWNWMFWEENAGCVFLNFENFTFPRERPLNNCTGNVGSFNMYLKNVSSMRILYNLYTAVFVIARALHDLSNCRQGNGPFVNRSCADISNFEPWQMLHYVKKVRVQLSSGREMFFDVNGEPPPVYDIVNWQLSPDDTINQVIVGKYDAAALNINASALKWANGSPKVSQISTQRHRRRRDVDLPVEKSTNQDLLVGIKEEGCETTCTPPAVESKFGIWDKHYDSSECFKCPWNQWPSLQKDRCLPKSIEYLSYEETLGVILTSTSVTSSMIPIAVLGMLIHYKSTPVIRANNYTISCLLLISLSLCFLSSLAFLGYPNHEKCLLRQVTFGTVFAFCVSCMLAKTFMVMIAFKATKPNSYLKKLANPQVLYAVIGLGTFIQLVICVMWLSMSPPFPEYNLNTRPEILVVECNERSPTAFWCNIGNLSLLAFASFLIAFLSRQLPDRYNEAKLITFSMFAFVCVWVCYIPASLSTSGKYTVAMEIFAILSSSWAMLCFMFAPKCYTILRHSNIKSRKQLLGRS